MAGDGRIQPGEVRNPTGRNQWTARKESEKAWDAIALAVRQNKRRLDAFLEKVWERAEAGDSYAMKAVLDRLLPITTRVELPPLQPQSHQFIPAESDQQALRNEIRGNGKALH